MSLRPYASTAEAITAAFGKNVTISGKARVYGGDINDAFWLRLSDGSTVFMKVNRRHKADFFRAEALGLEALASCGRIRIPAVIAYGNDPEYGAFLLMEYLETAVLFRPPMVSRRTIRSARPGRSIPGRHPGWSFTENAGWNSRSNWPSIILIPIPCGRPLPCWTIWTGGLKSPPFRPCCMEICGPATPCAAIWESLS